MHSRSYFGLIAPGGGADWAIALPRRTTTRNPKGRHTRARIAYESWREWDEKSLNRTE